MFALSLVTAKIGHLTFKNTPLGLYGAPLPSATINTPDETVGMNLTHEQGDEMRRGTLLLLATIGAMLVAATGVAFAATSWFGSDDRNDSYCGDRQPNIADGRDRADTIFARAGEDYLSGGKGNDAGTGNNDPNLTPATGLNCLGEDVPAAVRGGPDKDYIGGDAAADKIANTPGGPSNDGMTDNGSDDLVGNEGPDVIDDTNDTADDYDRVWGGTEDDKVNVADGDTLDQVDCGEGSKDSAKIDVLKDENGNVIKDADGKITRDLTWRCDGNLVDQDDKYVNPADPVKVSENQVSQNQLTAADDGSAAGEGGGPPPQPAERGPNSKSKNK